LTASTASVNVSTAHRTDARSEEDDVPATAPTATTQVSTTEAAPRYLVPDGFTRRVFNPLVAFATRHGLSLVGSRILTVAGRRSGLPRTTVVNLLPLDDRRFLVAPRGHTEWARNLRAATTAQIRVGRRTEEITATELRDADKLPVLREYLRRWRWEVGQFFEGIDHRSSDEELAAVAAGVPVFEVHATA
jgi:deazaflavin-dependent oxidoreductase (nitroreductase family)